MKSNPIMEQQLNQSFVDQENQPQSKISQIEKSKTFMQYIQQNKFFIAINTLFYLLFIASTVFLTIKLINTQNQLQDKNAYINHLQQIIKNVNIDIQAQQDQIRFLNLIVNNLTYQNYHLKYAVEVAQRYADFSSVALVQPLVHYAGPGIAKAISYFFFPQITWLLIWDNQIGDLGMKYLAQMNLTTLNNLQLQNNQISDEGIRIFTTMDLPLLGSLSFQSNNIGPQGMKYLVSVDYPELVSLFLCHNEIGTEGMKYLSTINAPYLQTLWLRHCQIGDQGMKYLATMKLTQLESLFLVNNSISLDGVKQLMKMNFTLLKQLDLLNNNIGNEGALLISQAFFPELTFLRLTLNNITSVSDLNPQNLPKIQKIDIGGNPLDEESKTILYQKFREKIDFYQ